MNDVLNIALIGCGDMGEVHASAIAQLAQVKLFACCDLIESKAFLLKDRYGAVYATT